MKKHFCDLCKQESSPHLFHRSRSYPQAVNGADGRLEVIASVRWQPPGCSGLDDRADICDECGMKQLALLFQKTEARE